MRQVCYQLCQTYPIISTAATNHEQENGAERHPAQLRPLTFQGCSSDNRKVCVGPSVFVNLRPTALAAIMTTMRPPTASTTQHCCCCHQPQKHHHKYFWWIKNYFRSILADRLNFFQQHMSETEKLVHQAQGLRLHYIHPNIMAQVKWNINISESIGSLIKWSSIHIIIGSWVGWLSQCKE